MVQVTRRRRESRQNQNMQLRANLLAVARGCRDVIADAA
jgi:hypothetical protein